MRGRGIALVTLLVLLAGVVAAEAWYLWLRDDPTPSAGRPVVTGPVETAAAVDAAARATRDIFTTSWEDYDEQVEQATGLMTEEYAAEYRRTAEDVEATVVEERTELTVDLLARGVIRSSPEEVEALLFLDQAVTRDGRDRVVTPYRAKVTVTWSDQGWLVSAVDTQPARRR